VWRGAVHRGHAARTLESVSRRISDRSSPAHGRARFGGRLAFMGPRAGNSGWRARIGACPTCHPLPAKPWPTSC
jgi:hypothetical protein